jgi:TM2 domain-containing membrane protein YozV
MTMDRTSAQYDIEKKSLIPAYILWFFLGYVGGHRFYLGRPLSGFIMLALSAITLLLTVVSFGVLGFLWFVVGLWWLVDALLIPSMAAGSNTRIADWVFSSPR